MDSHIMVGSNDLNRSKKFYDATFAALGAQQGFFDEHGRIFYVHKGGIFAVTAPIDGQTATYANGGTIGFSMENSAQADAWHKAAVEHGGTSIEDPPGFRDGGNFGKLYLAYVRDPDGNKLCGVFRAG